MNDKVIKWGFIGCGSVTQHKSGPAFKEIESSEVVAIMSRHLGKAEDYARSRGITKWYDDAQSLINDPEVNAVYIATPPSSHGRCLEATVIPDNSSTTRIHLIYSLRIQQELR